MDTAHAFAFKVHGDVTAVQMGTLITIGDRLGLYDTLAVGEEGAGIGEEKARELAEEAGFIHFRRIDFEHNPFNLFYKIRA